MKELIIYIVHIVIAVATVFIVFEFTSIENHFFSNFAVFVLTYFALWLASYFYNRSHFIKISRFFGLLFYFLKEMVIASLVVAWDVITPRSHVESGIICVPLDAKTDMEITLFASLISLTPGTLSIDVSEDKRFLYVHAVYIKDGDVEALKRQMKDGFERKLLAITRKYNG